MLAEHFVWFFAVPNLQCFSFEFASFDQEKKIPASYLAMEPLICDPKKRFLDFSFFECLDFCPKFLQGIVSYLWLWC